MTRFVAIKIHYDHRTSLAPALKYTRIPTPEEYQAYLDSYHDYGIGGEGFHECLNFRPADDLVKIYLPPTCIPRQGDDDIVFFSFTYKGDPQLPSHVVGVHAGARLLNSTGIPRDEVDHIPGMDRFHYHADAPADLMALFGEPLPYDQGQGRYTPTFRQWGYGLRYMDPTHADAILSDALHNAELRSKTASGADKILVDREVKALLQIRNTYGFNKGTQPTKKSIVTRVPLPNKQLGEWGERYVYEEEIKRVAALGLDPAQVKWVSQSVPSSVYDIESIRICDGNVVPYYLEVKTSSAEIGGNVYISARQIEFFGNNPLSATFILLSVRADGSVQRKDLTIADVHANYTLTPVKYKLT